MPIFLKKNLHQFLRIVVVNVTSRIETKLNIILSLSVTVLLIGFCKSNKRPRGVGNFRILRFCCCGRLKISRMN